MKYRTRNAVVAILAAGLLVMAGLSTVAAHGPGGPGFGHGGGIPGTSAKPLPSGWAWPSDLKTFAVKSQQPEPPKPSKAPKPTPKPVTCTTTPPVSSPTPAAAATARPLGDNGVKFRVASFGAAWTKQIASFDSHVQADLSKSAKEQQEILCNVIPLQKTLDARIASRIKSVQGWIEVVAKSGLGASDQATVDSELNSLIADLQAFKVKVDGETTLAALQADYATLNSKAAGYSVVQTWIQELVSAEKLINSGPGLVTLEGKIAADIAAAPAVSETADAQLYLDDMKLVVAAGEGVVAPLPATLLAITPAQLADGSAKATLTSVKVELVLATWDIQLGRMAGAWAEHEVSEAKLPPKATPTPTVTATPTATPTPTVAPTATPV